MRRAEEEEEEDASKQGDTPSPSDFKGEVKIPLSLTHHDPHGGALGSRTIRGGERKRKREREREREREKERERERVMFSFSCLGSETSSLFFFFFFFLLLVSFFCAGQWWLPLTRLWLSS